MIAAAVLVLMVIAYRVVLGIAGASDLQWLHNFSPLASVALCGAIYFPKRAALAFPLGALLVSDLFLNASYHVPLLGVGMIPQYLALGLVAAVGWLLRGRAHLWSVLCATVAGSIAYYVITNTGAWLMDPVPTAYSTGAALQPYARTFSGWVQALTTGVPGFPPTLTFFRHSLASDLIFTLLFLACLSFSRHRHTPEHEESLRADFARRLW